jgi:hypothetical protein
LVQEISDENLSPPRSRVRMVTGFGAMISASPVVLSSSSSVGSP